MATGQRNQPMAIAYSHLVVDGSQVISQSAFADVQPGCDGLGGFGIVCDECAKNFVLPCGQLSELERQAILRHGPYALNPFGQHARRGSVFQPKIALVNFLDRGLQHIS